MADIVEATYTYRFALPDKDSEEYRKLIERMFTESDAEEIAKEMQKGGEAWTPDSLRVQLVMWLVSCAQRGDFPLEIEEDFDWNEAGSTPPG